MNYTNWTEMNDAIKNMESFIDEQVYRNHKPALDSLASHINSMQYEYEVASGGA